MTDVRRDFDRLGTGLGSAADDTPDQRDRARRAVAARAHNPTDYAQLLAALGLDTDDPETSLDGPHSDETGPPVHRGTPGTPQRHTDDWLRAQKVG
jgi:hypothetical protein